VRGNRPRIRHPRESEESWTDERCYILETWNHPDDEAVSIARARVEPGVATRLHRLRGITERYIIISGQGRVEVGAASPTLVAPGDMVYIPPGCPQRILNPGETDLVFLAVCSPRFVPQAYEDIEPSHMSSIHIERTHDLGLESARAQVEELAQSLRDELQAEYEWNGDQLVFERPGASGTIDVGADRIDVHIELGWTLMLVSDMIEESINRRLDAALS